MTAGAAPQQTVAMEVLCVGEENTLCMTLTTIETVAQSLKLELVFETY